MSLNIGKQWVKIMAIRQHAMGRKEKQNRKGYNISTTVIDQFGGPMED